MGTNCRTLSKPPGGTGWGRRGRRFQRPRNLGGWWQFIHSSSYKVVLGCVSTLPGCDSTQPKTYIMRAISHVMTTLSLQISEPIGTSRRPVAEGGRPQVRHGERHIRRVRNLVWVRRQGLPLQPTQDGPLEPRQEKEGVYCVSPWFCKMCKNTRSATKYCSFLIL